MFKTKQDSRQKRNFIDLGHEITSSLPLQMCLYFNVILLPFWFTMTVTMLYMKFNCLTSIYQFIIILILVCLAIIESVRLYLGYLGNLSEKVPELAGFWVLSVILQLPLHSFLIFCPPIWPFPGECAVEGVMVVLLVAEVVSGFFALRKSALYQARRFHLQHLQRNHINSVKVPTTTELREESEMNINDSNRQKSD